MYLLSESPCAHVSWPSREGRSCDIYGAGVGHGLAWDTSPPRAMNRAATPLSRSVNVTPRDAATMTRFCYLNLRFLVRYRLLRYIWNFVVGSSLLQRFSRQLQHNAL